MEAANAAGEAVATQIGRYAQGKWEAADKAAEQAAEAGDVALAAQYREEADSWKEGSANRILLHAAGGALVAGLGRRWGGECAGRCGGGGGVGGGGGQDERRGGRDRRGDGVDDAGECCGECAGGGRAGRWWGGNAGAFAASNADLYNRQLHPDEKKWISENEAAFAKQYGITPEQAHDELTMQANLLVQNGSPGQRSERADRFLKNAHGLLPADGDSGTGFMFYATVAQRANPEMYAGYYADGVGLNRPADADVAQSVGYTQAYQDVYTKLTFGAAAGAALVAVAGPVAALTGVPIFSSGGALGSGAWASPAGDRPRSVRVLTRVAVFPEWDGQSGRCGGQFRDGCGGRVWRTTVERWRHTIGGATTTALNNILQGKNDSIGFGALASGGASAVGYGAGSIAGSLSSSALRPTINSQGWPRPVSGPVPSGWNLFTPNNLPSIRCRDCWGFRFRR